MSSGNVGEPLILIHSLGTGAGLWDPRLPALKEHFDVITYDVRGHGDPAWDGPDFSVEDCARDLEEMIRDRGLGRVHLFGLTLGGSIALCFAGMFPERVRSLVVADAAPWYGEAGARSWEERARATVRTPREETFQASLPLWFTPGFIASQSAEVARVKTVFMRTSNAGHAAACRALGGLDARPWLPRITAPTLVMTGELDARTPVAVGREVAESITGATFEVLPGLVHLTPIESPVAVKRALEHMLARQA
ncbi:MAG TPA: alpha/beta fold hydrolase [Candidatus Nitrosotalea sp.]|nr:alpha/beta fold hydrolase [Candidatus Nitrosotalea sp.]